MSPPPDDQRKQFTCKQCREVFVSEEALQEHLESCFQCDVCKQIFRKQYLVTTHQLVCMIAHREVTLTHRDSVDTDMTSQTSEEVSCGESGNHIEDNCTLPDDKQDRNKTDKYKQCDEAVNESGDHIEDNSTLPDDKQDRNKMDGYKLCAEAIDKSGHIEPDLREQESLTTSDSGKDLSNDNSLRINSRVDIANEHFMENLTSDMRRQGSDAPFKGNVKNKHSLDEHVDLDTGEKPHQCTTHAQITNHMRKHSPKKLYTCVKCGKGFSKELNMSIDMKLHIECLECGKQLDLGNDNSLQIDSRVDIANEYFTEDLTSDMRRQGSDAPFKCNVKNKHSLDEQVDLHTGEKPHQCSQCKKQFTTHDQLTNHMRRHSPKKLYTEKKLYECSDCGKCFNQKGCLKRHMKSHTGEKPHKCDVCGKSFTRNDNLTKHMRIHTVGKPYKCSDCGKCFKSNGSLTKHVKTHTGEKTHKCDVCGKSFTRRYNFTQHMRLHTVEEPYKCSDYGKSFESNGNLTKHMITHTGEKLHKCDVCGKHFTHRRNLVEHMRIHTGEKPYKCNECGKCFRTSAHITDHKRTHTGEKPYSCPVCGKAFRQHYSYTYHMKKHNGQ